MRHSISCADGTFYYELNMVSGWNDTSHSEWVLFITRRKRCRVPVFFSSASFGRARAVLKAIMYEAVLEDREQKRPNREEEAGLHYAFFNLSRKPWSRRRSAAHWLRRKAMGELRYEHDA